MEVRADTYGAEQKLSGGAKFGYFVLGFFLGFIGVLITWLVNRSKFPAIKKSAITCSAIGAIAGIVVGGVLRATVFAGAVAAYGAIV